MRQPVHSIIVSIVALTLAACAVVGLAGCRETDVLKELINDQTSENIDYDNPIKQYNNVPDAPITSEDFPQLKQSEDADIERERENVNAVQGDDFADIEAPDEKPQEDLAGETDGSQSKKDAASSKKKKGKGKKGNSGEGGKSADRDSKGTGDTEKAGVGGSGKTVDLNGANEPPENAYDTVVAFGECANIVMMLAGEGSLAGSNAEFLDNSFIQDAYADKRIGDVARISTEATTFDTDEVIAAKPEAVLVTNGTYEISDAQEKALKDADIDLVYLPGTNSHTSIKGLVKTIGTLFGDGSQTLSGKDAKGLAGEYERWVNDQVKSISRKNGGLMTLNGVNYDTGETDTSKAVSNDPARITWGLYVYDWDFDATYSASPNKSHLWDAQGVAIAKTGYQWSPLYYYMSVGGVNNNAAQFHVSGSRPTSLFYIWQFNLSYMSAAPSRFNNKTITTSKLEDFADNDILVRTQDDARSYSLGCDNFRTVITKSQAVSQALQNARDEGTRTQAGLYAAYRYLEEAGQTGIGLLAKQNLLVPAFIGYVEGIAGTLATHQSTAYARVEGGEVPYEVVTNPHGLYSNWADGSAESILECQWIDDLYHANGDFSATYATCREFYDTFYGYSLSDDQIGTILAGAEE